MYKSREPGRRGDQIFYIGAWRQKFLYDAWMLGKIMHPWGKMMYNKVSGFRYWNDGDK
jgi:hypothetical protein